MRRLLFVLTLAAVWAAVMLASALPAFGDGGAIKFSSGPCGDACSQITVTPSENINQQIKSHPNP
jgi:hypothetical protein